MEIANNIKQGPDLKKKNKTKKKKKTAFVKKNPCSTANCAD